MKSRYSRQELFREIGKKGQKIISGSTIAIVGVGALGSVSAELLTRAGIKKLILIDSDEVEASNLQRQSLYTEKDLEVPKVLAAKKHLEEINSKVSVAIHLKRLTHNNISLLKSDIIVDGTDNMETRFLINQYAKKSKTPYIYGAAAGSIGIVYNVMPDGPCLNCIFKNAKNLATCESEGILNSTIHMTASTQASEAIKILLKKKHSEDIIRFDTWKNKYNTFKVKKDKNCDVCNGNYSKKKELFTISECKTKSAYQVKPNKRIKLDIKKITRKFKTVEDAGIIAVIKVDSEEIIVHDYGELLFKTMTNTKKIREIANMIYNSGKV